MKAQIFACIVLVAIAYAVGIHCPPDDEGPTYFPHESNCTLFYQCAHGVPVVLDCKNGTHFNPELNVCDLPENANCEAENF